jgi:hypothetical protein
VIEMWWALRGGVGDLSGHCVGERGVGFW